MKKVIIVAIAKNRVIGDGERIPWHSKEEFKHFKSTTMGFPILMGRKTFESIKKPLPGRLNVIITGNTELKYDFENTVVVNSIDAAFEVCEDKYEKVFICGGGNIYKQTMDVADEIILSEMKLEPEGDVFFPEIDETKWETTGVEDFEEFKVFRYKKKN
ncbi:MAG: dihydrofolate reductase [Rhodothermaceae bacterium]